jgi:hypothetical protein
VNGPFLHLNPFPPRLFRISARRKTNKKPFRNKKHAKSLFLCISARRIFYLISGPGSLDSRLLLIPVQMTTQFVQDGNSQCQFEK